MRYQNRKTRTYAEFARIIDEIIDLGYKNCNNVTNICNRLGYSNGVSTSWRKSGIVPEVAIWAIRGFKYSLKSEKVGFTQEDIHKIIHLAVDANDKKLVNKAMDLLK